jgi:hypothetical protein
MSPSDPIVPRELPVIQKIIDDETWLEGERRGCPVSPYDPVVCDRVCDIVLRIGSELRRSILAGESLGLGSGSDCFDQAA